jgi:hypothetical protein
MCLYTGSVRYGLEPSLEHRRTPKKVLYSERERDPRDFPLNRTKHGPQCGTTYFPRGIVNDQKEPHVIWLGGS